MAAAQPDQNTAYNAAGNAATKEPAEQQNAEQKQKDDAPRTDQRIPSQQTSSIDEATPTSMARGVRGGGPGENPADLTDQEQGVGGEVHAEQALATLGEGETADAVQKKPGATGGEPGFDTDLDKKKAEQAPLREKQKEEEKKEVDVAGVLGQRKGAGESS